MMKKTTYLKIIFDSCLYQFIAFTFPNLIPLDVKILLTGSNAGASLFLFSYSLCNFVSDVGNA